MHFVVNQMVKLEHMHESHCDPTIKGIAGAPVMERDLGLRLIELKHLCMWIIGWISQIEHCANLLFRCTVKDRRGKGNAPGQVASQFNHFVIA